MAKQADTALICIDMQNDFLLTSSPLCVKCGLACLPHVQEAIAAARAKSLPIVWIIREHDPSGSWIRGMGMLAQLGPRGGIYPRVERQGGQGHMPCHVITQGVRTAVRNTSLNLARHTFTGVDIEYTRVHLLQSGGAGATVAGSKGELRRDLLACFEARNGGVLPATQLSRCSRLTQALCDHSQSARPFASAHTFPVWNRLMDR